MKKKIIKLSCAILAFLLIGFILFMAFSFIGNPLSKIIVSNVSKKYVEKTYPNLNLDVEEPVYSFKFGTYVVHCSSKTSSDTRFSLDFNYNGKLIQDNYDSHVAGGFNTLIRLQDQYRKDLEQLLKLNFKYDYDYITVDAVTTENLPLDCEYDLHSDKVKLNLSVNLYSDERTWDNLAKTLVEIDAVMSKNNININNYSLVLSNPLSKPDSTYEGEDKSHTISIYDFPKELLNYKNLSKELEGFYKAWLNKNGK